MVPKRFLYNPNSFCSWKAVWKEGIWDTVHTHISGLNNQFWLKGLMLIYFQSLWHIAVFNWWWAYNKARRWRTCMDMFFWGIQVIYIWILGSLKCTFPMCVCLGQRQWTMFLVLKLTLSVRRKSKQMRALLCMWVLTAPKQFRRFAQCQRNGLNFLKVCKVCKGTDFWGLVIQSLVLQSVPEQ